VPLLEMDLKSGARILTEEEALNNPKKTWKSLPMRIVRGLF
jgi:hypothetical protein